MGDVIARIPLTGGPKGGKTRIIEKVKEIIEKEYGYKVFVVQETATEIIKSGFIPYPFPEDGNEEEMKLFYETNKAFQQMILDLQLAKEKAFEKGAKSWPEDVVILYDRGVMDNYGYLMKNLKDKELFKKMLSDYNLTVADVLNYYDAVISLETSVNIVGFDTQDKDDTTKRIEASINDSLAVDYYVSKAWMSHPNYIRINATEDFQDKENMVLDSVREVLNKKKEKILTR